MSPHRRIHPSSPLLGEYMLHLRRRGLTAATRENYLSVLKGYVASHDPAKVSTAAIEGWLDDRRLGARARYTYICCIDGLHKWLIDTGQATENPCATVVRPKLPRRFPRPASTGDLANAIEHAPPRMKLWLCLAAYGGLRCMEIAGLRVEDIRLDSNPPILHLRETKGDKDHVVPIAEEVLRALEAYGPPLGGPVFPAISPIGKPLRPVRALPAHYVSQEINSYLHGRGISATAHQLRHWFGTELYRRTLDLKLVGTLMGHAQLTTTSLYVALVPTEEAFEAVRSLKAVVDAAPERTSLKATA